MSHPALGKAYPPFAYEVGLEKIREFAQAIGASNPVHGDGEAAVAEGFRDVVAPPMFAVVYMGGSVAPGMFDPEVGINVSRMLHSGQEIEWGEPVCRGDVITTVTTFRDSEEAFGRTTYVFESVSRNQDDVQTARGTWTFIVVEEEEL
jgi:acyl dehydratase